MIAKNLGMLLKQEYDLIINLSMPDLCQNKD